MREGGGGERLPWIGGLEEYVGFQQSEIRRVDIPGGEMAQARLWKKRKKQAKLEHRVCIFEREKEKLEDSLLPTLGYTWRT